MITGFWLKLNKPFFCLAPMADVTDAVFRRVIAKYGKPDVLWTEFVSADGLMHETARPKLLVDFIYTESERPIVAQIFGSRPENIEGAAKLAKELGFDGVDINMGCPDRAIERQGAGAAAMKDKKLAGEIIEAARRGAPELPISVKTRIGWNNIELEWIKFLLEQKLPALTVHLRTRKEMSKVAAHWELMPDIIKLRDEISPETLLIGNGDVRDMDHARELAVSTGCDGVMLGRAIFGNPWLFSQSEKSHAPSVAEKLRVMVEHTKLFEEILGGKKNFSIMKKHYKAYVNGFNGSKELRMKLMEEANNASDVEKIVSEYLSEFVL